MLFPDSRTNVQALAVNEASVVVGNGRLFAGGTGTRAVRWDSARSPIVLGDLGSSPTGDTNAAAWAINSAGDAVGTADKYDAMGNYDGVRAVRWGASTTTALELEVLGTDGDGFNDSKVFDINDAGVAAGYTLKYGVALGLNQGRHAVLWNAFGQVRELGHLPGLYVGGEAYDVNEHGIAVGTAERPEQIGSQFVAVYWDAYGRAVDLNTLIAPRNDWVLTQAWAISDSGWILGQGSHTDDALSYSRVFMMQVPVSPADLPGDYNDDGTVNAADYTVWRDNLGASVTLPNDTTPGSVIAFDYEVWKANFGATVGEGSGANVPEPAGLMLATIILAAALLRQFLYVRRYYALVAALFACSNAVAIDIETVLIGDSGNPADNRVMNDGTSGYGGVAYEYRIGKYEVTNDQYAVFLNAIATTDTFEIYEQNLMGNSVQGGIVRSGGVPNYVYTVKPNMGDKPVDGVTTAAAMRFVNWLQNGQPSGTQTTATTEAGTYDLTGPTLPLTRSASANWWIPNDNEWYKAAYYDPRDAANGGPPGDSHYWRYATKSLGLPTAATADAVGNIANPGATTANYNSNANWNGSAPFGNVTTVGSAGPTSASYYGTFDQSGNVFEHNDTPTQFGPNTRVQRGGKYNSLSDAIGADLRGYCGGCYAGLRVASVLDPPGPNDDLLAYWNAENGAVDVTGNGHDGTFQGNAMTMAGGPFGNAFAFDGSGDYIDIGDELDMGTSDFTLAAWIKGDPSMGQWARIFDKGYASAYSLHRRASTNEIGFEMLSSGNVFATDTPLIDNTWHHVALVKNGTTVTIYADGEAENTSTVSAAAQNNSRPLLIGYNPGEGTLGYWKGKLDELKIFGRALTPAEIAALAMNPNENLPGDYNGDGTVNAADYAVWRDNLGASVTLPNDTTPGSITAEDYNVWRSNFRDASGARGAEVPEPGATILIAVASALVAGGQLRRGNAVRADRNRASSDYFA